MSTSVKKKAIMDAAAMRRALVRIAHRSWSGTRVYRTWSGGDPYPGVPLANRLGKEIQQIEGGQAAGGLPGHHPVPGRSVHPGL